MEYKYNNLLLFNNIQYLAQKRKVTIKYVEKKILDRSNGYITKIKTNESKPGISELIALCNFFNVNLNHILSIDLASIDNSITVLDFLEGILYRTQIKELNWCIFNIKNHFFPSKVLFNKLFYYEKEEHVRHLNTSMARLPSDFKEPKLIYKSSYSSSVEIQSELLYFKYNDTIIYFIPTLLHSQKNFEIYIESENEISLFYQTYFLSRENNIYNLILEIEEAAHNNLVLTNSKLYSIINDLKLKGDI